MECKVDVSVVVVTWNSRDLIDRCLKPFAEFADWLEVIVYDNNSPDETADYIAKNYPWVHLIWGTENLGFGRGNNAAFTRCRGRYVLMLNPDAFLDSLAPIAAMRATLDASPDVAAVGPQLVHENGRHQVGDAGWSTRLTSVAGHVFWLHRAISSVPSIYVSNPSLLGRPSVEVEWLCGACMMVRRSVLEDLKGFDESIFMYGEDVDLGERICASGHRILYIPHIRVVHVQGATQKAKGAVYFSSGWMDARAKRLAINRSFLTYLAFRTILIMGFGLRFALLTLVGLAVPRFRSQALMMRRYAERAIRLPSFAAQRTGR